MKPPALPLVLSQWPEPEARLIARWKYLTEAALPQRAKQEHWALRLDHCFKRVCLDFAFQDVWYRHLPKPAEQHLHGDPLRLAVQCAEDIYAQGKLFLRERNRESLAYREKLKGGRSNGKPSRSISP